MNDEVYFIMAQLRESREVNDVFKSTYAHLEKLALTVDQEQIRSTADEMRSGLMELEMLDATGTLKSKLHRYEIAQMANLFPPECSVEEAKAWIESLKQYDDNSVQNALDIITRAKNRV